MPIWLGDIAVGPMIALGLAWLLGLLAAVTAIEGLLLWKPLGWANRRHCLWDAWWVNAVSTAVGIVYAMTLVKSSGFLLTDLGLFYLPNVLLEAVVLRRLRREKSWKDALVASLVVNVASYLFLAGFFLLFYLDVLDF